MSEVAARRGQRLHPEDWYDVAFTAALTALSLTAWDSTYRGTGLWYVGLGAILAGLVVAVVVARLGRGPELVVLGLGLVYVLGAGPVARGRDALAGLDALLTGPRATLQGWPMLVATHPFVDASGPALLPVALVCLLAAGLTASLAMRSEVPGRPLVPQLLLLVVVLFLSRAEAVGVLLHGLGFGLLALLWLRVRGAQSETAEAGRDPARHQQALGAVAMVALAAVLAAVLAGSTPVEQRLVLRGLLPAYDVSAVRTPLDAFRDYTERRPAPDGNVYAERLLEVRGAPAGTRMRFAALDTYDGTRWRAANDTDPERIDDRFLRLSSTLDNPASGQEREVVVTPLRGWAIPWVPTTGSLQGFDFLGAGDDALTQRLRYDPATQTGVMTQRLEPGDRYVFATRTDDLPLEAGTDLSDAVDEDLYDTAAFLDPAVSAWAAGAATPAEAVLQVARRLRSAGRYSDGAGAGDDYPAGHSRRRLGPDFVLATPSVGNDEQYAAAMALMANRLRVPARVVVGAVLGDDGVVQGRDVEAWVEVRAADGSWRTLATDRFMGRRPPPRSPGVDPGTGSSPERIFPERTPDDVSPPEPEPQRPDPTPEPEPDTQDEPERDSADAADPDDGTGWAGWAGRVLLVLLVLALPGVVPGFKWWRRRRRLRAEVVRRRYAGAWAELVDTARDLGHPVPAGLTRPAQARVLDRGESVGGLATEADVRIFGLDEPTEDEAAAFWALVDDERTGLAATYSRRRRLRALFSLASLRPPRS